MTALLGVNDLKNWALPSGWDATKLQEFQLADGTTLDVVYNEFVGASIAAAQTILEHPVFGNMVYVTTEPALEYRNGLASTGLDARSEYTRADAKRSQMIGHMLPEGSFDRSLGFTMDFLRKVRMSHIEAHIEDVIYDVVDEFQRQALTRFFSNTENVLGSSGYDLPFANASSNVVYTPPAYAGQTFASSHTHFDRKGTSNHLDAIKAGARHLAEHGIMGPYVGIIPEADVATYQAVTGFTYPELGSLATVSNTDRLAVDESVFIGGVHTRDGWVLLHATPRVPTNYFGMFKAYGSNDRRNSLAVRVSTDYLFTPVFLRGDGFRVSPLENMTLIHEYGVGVNRGRLNGYLCEFDSSGSYGNPTIS